MEKKVNKTKMSDEQVNQFAKKVNVKLGDVIDKTDKLIKKLQEQSDFDKYYSDIEEAIIRWNIDGTKTAGHLTRQIIKILKKKKKK